MKVESKPNSIPFVLVNIFFFGRIVLVKIENLKKTLFSCAVMKINVLFVLMQKCLIVLLYLFPGH